MATITWPEELPQAFLADGFDEGEADNTLRDPFDTGPAALRARSTANVRPLAGRMAMSSAEWDALKAFYRDTTVRGTLAFGFPDPGGGGELLVRFTAAPRRAYAAIDHWVVALAFEVLP